MTCVTIFLVTTISSEENFVYRDFFTFTAVAWFTGGVISPLTLTVGQTVSVQIIIMTAIATIFSLKAATLFTKKDKK